MPGSRSCVTTSDHATECMSPSLSVASATARLFACRAGGKAGLDS
jgi:hypothetical protein